MAALPVAAALTGGLLQQQIRSQQPLLSLLPAAQAAPALNDHKHHSATTTNDCVSSTALLVLRGFGAGLAWTIAVDAYALLDVPDSYWQERIAGTTLTKRGEITRTLLRAGARNMFGFASFLGIFGGVSCSLEQLRGCNDFVNPFMGGFTAGLALLPGELRTPRAILSSALLCGVASMGIHLIVPTSGSESEQEQL